MSENRGVLIVGPDLVIKGHVRNCQRVEIHGYVEGEVVSRELLIHQGGRLFGRARAQSAVVNGHMQGDVQVKDLVSIGSTGDVSGNVRYGKLAMEVGANLSADVRNVPPELAGDLEMSVARGQSVRVTLQDLNAIDPDNKATELVFAVGGPRHGFIVLDGAPDEAVTGFTQADLEAGRVLFRHDGSGTSTASFEVSVTDVSGASSGAPQRVHVTVGG